MANEWELRRSICEIGRRMYEKGFVAANDGNISCRLSGERFLCTPTAVSKGFLKPDMLVVVDASGKKLSGTLQRTSEILLHLAIYRELPKINAVCHAHPPHATAFATAGVALPTGILPEVEILLGRVPLAEYDTPGSKELAGKIIPHLRNKANTILLANHGAVACDETLEQAYHHLETLDMYCRILLLSKEIGSIRPLGETKMRELLEVKKTLGIADPRIGPGEQVAALAGSDEFLRGFSTRAIPQHTPDANGHGRGDGIADMPSQAGQPQPIPSNSPNFPAVVAGREIPSAEKLGSSSKTVRKRAIEDEIERMVQLVTDQIVAMAAGREERP